MRYKSLAQVVSLVVVSVFAVGIWSTGGDVDLGWLRFFSLAVLIATAVLNLWDRFLWRIALAQRIAGVPRDVRGTWKGTLTSFWQDPTGGEAPSPKTVYLVVRQTSTTVSVVLFTDELRSNSTLARVQSSNGLLSLNYLYVGRPESRLEDRSRMHNGSASLDIAGLPATRLRGRYWTDRDSRGELEFSDRSSKLADDYQGARDLFE